MVYHIRHNTLLLILLLLVGLTSRAQQPVYIDHEYPFVNYSASQLHYDTASPYFKHLFHRWHHVVESGQGNINIVHIGSSHVQGGTFPNRLRTNLMEELPDLVADRGMIFPYSAAAKCNNPPDYIVHCPEPVTLTRNVSAQPAHDLGLCGIAITAHDRPTHIDIVLRHSHIDYATRQVIILGHTTDSIIPLLSVLGRDIAPSYIDTDTRRYIFNLAETTDSFQIILPCTAATSFTLTGIYLGNRQPGFSYHSIGVNGASLADYQKCTHFADDLRLLHPDLVILGIGINDAACPNFDTAIFRQRYLALVNTIRSVAPNCAFIFITNNDSSRPSGRGRRRRYTTNPNGALAREAFYRIAADAQGAVWDQFEVMGGLHSMDHWIRQKLAQRDHVHFTSNGYSLLGDLLYNAIVQAYLANPQPSSLPADAIPHPSSTHTSTPHPSTDTTPSTPNNNTSQPSTRNEQHPYISY